MAKKQMTAAQKAAKRQAERARRDRKRAEKDAAKAEKAGSKPAAPADAPPGDAKPVSSKLKLLSDANDKRIAHWRDPKSRRPKPNGIACPKCGEELSDKDPGLVVPGNPPRVEIRCGKGGCEFHGRRVA